MRALIFFPKKKKKRFRLPCAYKRGRGGIYYIIPLSAPPLLPSLQGELRITEIDEREAFELDVRVSSRYRILIIIGNEMFWARFHDELETLETGIEGSEQMFFARKDALVRFYARHRSRFFLSYDHRIHALTYRQGIETHPLQKVTSAAFRSFVHVVYPVLSQKHLTVKDVVKLTGRSPTVVRKHLDRMVEGGLIGKFVQKSGTPPRRRVVYDRYQHQLW